MEIRIRTDLEGRGHKLADVPFDQLDTVIPTLNAWGLNAFGDDVGSTALCGQFMLDDSGAYFEILIGEG